VILHRGLSFYVSITKICLALCVFFIISCVWCFPTRQICACIGSRIDNEALGFLVGEVCLDSELLEIGEADIVLERKAILPTISDGLSTESRDGASVSFIHDSVQSAAYSLLPTEEQAPFHLKLGQALNSKLNLSTSPSHIMFTAANQLACAYELVQENERIEVDQIFLRAGDESKSADAFRGAHYFYAKANGVLRSCDKIYIFCTSFASFPSSHISRCVACTVTITTLSKDWLTEYDLSLKAQLSELALLKMQMLMNGWILSQ